MNMIYKLKKQFRNAYILVFLIMVGCLQENANNPIKDEFDETIILTASTCIQRCLDDKTKQYSSNSCHAECSQKRTDLGLNDNICTDLCADPFGEYQNLAQLECKAACKNDADGDSVPDQLDLCPNTPNSTQVTWRGCPDSDGDRVADKFDDCAATEPGTSVDTRGCPLSQACSDGRCSNYYPSCATELECARNAEIPLARHVPLRRREQMIRTILSRKYADVVCPDDTTAPPQPRILQPDIAIKSRMIYPAEAEFIASQLVGGTKVQLDFEWEEVQDPCQPVTYSLYLESYYCDGAIEASEAASYLRHGWCQWMPLLYESTDKTSYGFEFEFGKHLFKMHENIDYNFVPPLPQNGSFTIDYRPFWIRVSVIAHDGNARASAFGAHEPHKYIVLFMKATLEAVNQIPVAP